MPHTKGKRAERLNEFLEFAKSGALLEEKIVTPVIQSELQKRIDFFYQLKEDGSHKKLDDKQVVVGTMMLFWELSASYLEFFRGLSNIRHKNLWLKQLLSLHNDSDFVKISASIQGKQKEVKAFRQARGWLSVMEVVAENQRLNNRFALLVIVAKVAVEEYSEYNDPNRSWSSFFSSLIHTRTYDRQALEHGIARRERVFQDLGSLEDKQTALREFSIFIREAHANLPAKEDENSKLRDKLEGFFRETADLVPETPSAVKEEESETELGEFVVVEKGNSIDPIKEYRNAQGLLDFWKTLQQECNQHLPKSAASDSSSSSENGRRSPSPR